MRNTELAKRLGISEAVVRRMLDPKHDTKPEKIQASLAALGKRIVVRFEDAALQFQHGRPLPDDSLFSGRITLRPQLRCVIPTEHSPSDVQFLLIELRPLLWHLRALRRFRTFREPT